MHVYMKFTHEQSSRTLLILAKKIFLHSDVILSLDVVNSMKCEFFIHSICIMKKM